MKFLNCIANSDHPKLVPGEAVTVRFLIFDFLSRTENSGEYFLTDTVVVHGYPFKLMIYPRGDNGLHPQFFDHISVHLRYVEGDLKQFPVDVRAILRCNGGSSTLKKHTFDENRKSSPLPGFARRDESCDEFGTLTINLEMYIETEKKMVWYPPSTHLDHIGTKLFRSNKESDVSFTVGSSGKVFKAHKCVLALSSTHLYELVLTELNDNNEESYDINITLADVDETAFEKILKFIYIGEYPVMTNDEEKSIKDIFLTADRLNCTDLKLYAESVLIEKYLVPSNAAEMLLFADSHSCSLLKEASMNAYATDPKTAMASEDGWSKLVESKDLIVELLVYTNLGRKTYSPVADSTASEDVDSLDVTSLRERLQKSNLDYDGSREMLVKRWKGAIA
jgi:hypothetical protein